MTRSGDETRLGDAVELGDATLTVVSNREPYVHAYDDGAVTVTRPTGGLVAALDEVVADVGGTWVAWGSGEADFDPDVAPDGEVRMPPESAGSSDTPGYTLSRVDLPVRLVDDYYSGYANQVLWPLCHLDTNHVRVDPAFFPAYEEANERFADRVVATDPDVVWFQDYHLALAPRAVRDRLPDARLAHFWNVPWPGPETFEICPHADALLSGLLANDAVGFHLPRYAENFLACVDEFVLGATVDVEPGTVAVDDRTGPTRTVDIYDSPIGVAPDRVADAADSRVASDYWDRVVDRHGIDTGNPVLLGVDRLDYTKGIVERLDALDHLLNTTPSLVGEFTLFQKASRTREGIPAYRRYHDAVRERITDLEDDHGTDDWSPVVYVEEHIDDRELAGLYRNADVAVVSARRDGMNLVAKEFVAASEGSDSALVLSRFAGAADSLCPAALSVNPYDVGEFAETIRRALELDEHERRRRMERLSAAVREEDIHRWLATQLAVLAGE